MKTPTLLFLGLVTAATASCAGRAPNAGCDRDRDPSCEIAEGEGELGGGEGEIGCVGELITVAPARCDFGEVGVGQGGTCTLSIANAGSADLFVNDISFSAGTDPAFTLGPFAIPGLLQAGSASSLTISGAPTSASLLTGAVLLASNDRSCPTVEVPLSMQGTRAPTAIARVKSVNGVTNSAENPAIAPLDDVVLSADESVDSAGITGSIVGYQWTLVSVPADSAAQLDAPTSVDTSLSLDVAGAYAVKLTVSDATGTTSTNAMLLVLNAVPTQALHIQMTWSATTDDLDLHFGRGADPDWCSADDCYYANCTPGDTMNLPDWDGGGYGGAGDPHLDIDDLSGFGPENTSILTATNGTYVIGVDAQSMSQPTDVSVKIFLLGVLVEQIESHMESANEWWNVARIDVNDDVPTIAAINTIETDWSCEE